MIPATLVLGTDAAARETAIAAALESAPQAAAALILEGMADGADRFGAFSALHVARIAPGCPCCTGNLTMRVTLNRMLRLRPTHLYVGLASAGHLSGIRDFLSQPPYDSLLTLTDDLRA